MCCNCRMGNPPEVLLQILHCGSFNCQPIGVSLHEFIEARDIHRVRVYGRAGVLSKDSGIQEIIQGYVLGTVDPIGRQQRHPQQGVIEFGFRDVHTQPFPDLFEAIDPDVVDAAVLPVIVSGGDGSIIFPNQNSLDRDRAKLDPDGCFAFFYFLPSQNVVP